MKPEPLKGKNMLVMTCGKTKQEWIKKELIQSAVEWLKQEMNKLEKSLDVDSIVWIKDTIDKAFEDVIKK